MVLGLGLMRLNFLSVQSATHEDPLPVTAEAKAPPLVQVAAGRPARVAAICPVPAHGQLPVIHRRAA